MTFLLVGTLNLIPSINLQKNIFFHFPHFKFYEKERLFLFLLNLYYTKYLSSQIKSINPEKF